MKLTINDRIKSRSIEFFNSVEINLSYDSIASSFSFSFYFDPENSDHKEIACIGHFHICEIGDNGELLLSGYVVSQTFKDTSKAHMVTISGYSFTGVLEDCTIPISAYPLQYDGLTIREIAAKLIAPFGLQMVVDPLVNSRIDKKITKTTASNTQSVKDFLTEICAQQKIIISHDAKGRLVFTEEKTSSKPILKYNGGLPFYSMSLVYNGQAMHSEITVLKQASDDSSNAGQVTIKNPFVPFAFRPKTVIQSSGDDVDTDLAAKNALSAELKGLKLVIDMDRWDIEGVIIKPNNTVLIKNPRLYLYNETKWFIESVKLSGDEKGKTAVLDCVLPEIYSLETPKYLFKGVNLHG